VLGSAQKEEPVVRKDAIARGRRRRTGANPATSELTRREHEVAQLLTRGLTNRQIAEKLVIAERTAEHHVEQIRYKLGFHTRSQIAVWAASADGQPNADEAKPARASPPVARAVRGVVLSRRRLVALIVTAALLISAEGVAITYFFGHAPLPVADTADSIIQIDDSTAQPIGKVAISGEGGELAMGDGAIWEISPNARTLSRINPRTHALVASYGVPGAAPPVALAVGADSVWVATAFGDKALWRFDPRTEHFRQPIGPSVGLSGVAYGAGALWMADKTDDVVYRVDPRTDTVTARIPVGEGPEGICVDFGSVWVVNAVDGSVSRIDAASATLTETIALRAAPSAIATGRGAVWVVSESSSVLIRIDPATNTTTEIPLGIGPSAVAVTDSVLWVSHGVAGEISRIDFDSFKVSATTHVHGAVNSISSDGRSVWATVHASTPASAGIGPDPLRGGTLRVAMPAWAFSDLANPDPQANALDPQIRPGLDAGELFRCCLLRTLVSHTGLSYRDGGAELRPDLAARLPDVSADGMTWTFHLRPGLYYAPPLDKLEISAADFVRALERDARLKNTEAALYSPIEGFDQYRDRRASVISGLDTPDRYTLKVRLTAVTGDLPDRFARSDTAPLPPRDTDASAEFGAAAGHDSGYGRFLVSSGPYMIEGSRELDFSLSPERQAPVSGLRPGHSLMLVRNPSWSRDTDPLRPAYVDRIEIAIGISDDEAADFVDTGRADIILRGSPPPQAMPWLIEKVRADPRLGRVEVNSRDFLRIVSMNLAVPPFDDIHVRRAVNYILDKRALLEAHGGDLTGRILTHYVPDSLENDALVGYDPYATPGARGSLELAKQEMKQSRYDPGHIGMCGAPECKHVLGLTIKGGPSLFPRLFGGFPRLAAIIADNLGKIGIAVDVQSPPDFFDLIVDPAARVPLALTPGLGPNYPSASSTFPADFSSAALGTSNMSLIGATPDQLRVWGYSVTSIPSLERRIHECMLGGLRQTQCWTALDVYVMEKIVPIAPYTLETVIDVVPSRVVNYSFDQSSDAVALDQLAIRH